jgi:hypothetical protein
MGDDYAAVIAGYIAAAKAGNVLAARYLLETFVLHADAFTRQVPRHDAMVIEFLREALSQILSGVPAARALCVERNRKGRAPSARLNRNFVYFVAVGIALKDHGSVDNAIAKVARSKRVSTATVRAAWNREGGSSAWKEWKLGFAHSAASVRAAFNNLNPKGSARQKKR